MPALVLLYLSYCHPLNLFKGYILPSDGDYLDGFNAHYKSIQKYMRRGPLWVDVHMHKPTTNVKNFMDALAATSASLPPSKPMRCSIRWVM